MNSGSEIHDHLQNPPGALRTDAGRAVPTDVTVWLRVVS